MLVTGRSGFVGGWLVGHLADIGDDIVALDDDLDILDEAALTDAVVAAAPDAICHLAAQASVGASWKDPATTFSVNTIGTVRLLAAAEACGARPRVLLISSAEVYGAVTPHELPLREDRTLAPASPYAASKAAAEMAGIGAWLGRGLEVLRARPFNHTGPGQRPDFVVPSLARQVAQVRATGAPSLLAGNLEARRDIADVRDVVVAYRALLEHGAPGEVYNVCTGRSVAIADVARALLDAEGLDVPIEVDPARIRPIDIPELRGDPAALTAATGWSPSIPLDQTLRDILAAFRTPAA